MYLNKRYNIDIDWAVRRFTPSFFYVKIVVIFFMILSYNFMMPKNKYN